MDTHIQQLKNSPDIRVIGKSSVGMIDETERNSLSIPEYNRMELVDAADLLIVDRSQLLLPDLLRDAVKKGKHLYINDYPELLPDQCFDLLKLAGEAQTVIHICNHLLSENLTGWLSHNWQEPAYITLFESLPELPDKRVFLIKNLFYAFSLFKSYPQKIRVSGIHQPDNGFYFISIRLDYSTYSTFNLELLIQPGGSRTIQAAMPGKYLAGDFLTRKAFLNQKEIVIPAPPGDRVFDFIHRHADENFPQSANFDLYYSTLVVVQDVLRKIDHFTPWH